MMAATVRSSIRSSVIHRPMTGNYTRHDLCFGKYFKAVNTFGRAVLSFTFSLIYQTLDTNGGTMPVMQFCLLKLKWSKTNFNKVFTTVEKEILSKDPTDTEFVCDVTLLFKLIVHILGNLTEPVKKELRELKNMRNSVCHEELVMDESELEHRMEALKAVCRTILVGVGAVVGQDLTSNINEVETGLQNLIDAELESNDIESYLKDLNKFRQEKHSAMISEARKELMNTYSQLRILNPCPWLSDSKFADFTVDNIFTDLIIKVADKGTDVPVSKILDLDMMADRYVARLVIVKAVMGSGKTSLYRYLLQEWCAHSPTVTGLAGIDLVIAMEMKNVSCGSLVQFLREQLLKSTSRLFSESDVIPILQEMNLLFLIDGMDEATSHGKAIVKEIVNKFTDSQIIITTRPEFTLELRLLVGDHVVLQINGFDETSQNVFIKKVFSIKYPDKIRQDEEIQSFLDFRRNVHASLSSHLMVPLTLALILILWCDDFRKVTSVSTSTRLYQKMYEMCQQKLKSQLESSGDIHGTSLERKLRRWLMELGQIAWHMVNEDVIVLNQKNSDQLMDVCERENLDVMKTMSTFLSSTAIETLTGTIYQFSFPHRSGQEFLAAMYVAEQVIASKSFNAVIENVDCSRFQELIMYVTGLLKSRGELTTMIASEIKNACFQMGIQASDANWWWRLLNEAENHPAMIQIVGSVVNQVSLWVINSWDLKENTEAKLNLLRETRAAPFEVVINVQYTTRFEDCSQLHIILMLLSASGRSKVKLYLESHFRMQGDEVVLNRAVVPLLTANMLLEYKGHGGMFFARELVKAVRLQSLFMRVSSIHTLWELRNSIRKHRHWKTLVMPAKKWALKYLELFLDISPNTKASEVPRLHYHKKLVLKFTEVRDENAEWAGTVIKRLNSSYTSVILQSSHLTLQGMKELLDASQDADIKVFRVMSDQLVTQEQVQALSLKTRVKIGWGHDRPFCI